ncbi:MAG: NAD(P)/FAD-dependent oxidoreductase [Chloroflexi bacterium]|nr:NAD(P)/FAD-dependent oxidoreductase [Chloroflexota bacterium]MXX83266.1 NAD(P)/FAD-dependent oxidoreductase [Chloroflexota bacterium]MYC56652.1 NAD(P)/FAD-dependent oxidoreductase [Chloroflexota bacterium]MYD39753.1 NAD(P)/FAD-dependent oxidoreductase [Chloroflexota bacterium]MYH66747.1 NAD(P)/FAD-dependent oxidoreductase [Chloroflexota bacterium]
MYMREELDVLIVGAGISGIAAGYYLDKRCPGLRWRIVEARESLGGTWDLFRYPGVRSDSDMYTLGYRFRPWRGEKAIADGAEILQYLKATAHEFGIDKRIHFQQRVRQITWSSAQTRWTVAIEPSGGERYQLRCKFLFMCTGYYRYDRGYSPDWPGMEAFQGQVLHPQFWRSDLDLAGKRVVVIGSGATAVTLVPALARAGAEVTMLQRSPSYIVSMASRDELALRLQARLPLWLSAKLTRWRLILRGIIQYRFARSKPDQARAAILDGVRSELGDDYDIKRHFNPRYPPWDQRVCLVPDGDLFKAMREGKVTIVTDHIQRFDEAGIVLESGQRLPADIIVTATGLVMRILHGLRILVDDEEIALGETYSYKGVMYSGLPNLASAFGYTNASWTLRAELVCEYVCRLLKHMQRHGYAQCTPRLSGDMQSAAFVDFTSGYVQRALPNLPKQGARHPWKLYQNYLRDILSLRYGRLHDGSLEWR